MARAKTTVLFLDDSEIHLTEVGLTLHNAGFEIRTASTIEEAERQLHGADLVIVDYHMPGADGASALKRFRARVARDALSLFYLYTYDHEVAVRYKELGFDGAFTGKGDASILPRQVASAVRLLELRKMREQRRG